MLTVTISDILLSFGCGLVIGFLARGSWSRP